MYPLNILKMFRMTKILEMKVRFEKGTIQEIFISYQTKCLPKLTLNLGSVKFWGKKTDYLLFVVSAGQNAVLT